MHHSKLNFSSHTTTQSVISGRVDRQQLEQLEESTMGWWWWAYLTQANTSLILMPNQFLVIFQFLFISHRQHTALSLSLWQSKLMMAGINARRKRVKHAQLSFRSSLRSSATYTRDGDERRRRVLLESDSAREHRWQLSSSKKLSEIDLTLDTRVREEDNLLIWFFKIH